MAVFYNKERAKYGHLTGQVIAWPVPYEGTPDISNNKKSLPAGYLKCDGTKYFVKDYPRLAEICGSGSSCKFIRKNLDGTDFDTLTDSQFMVPDLGSKYPEPTTGANAGVYNNVRKVDTTTNTEKSRSGIGIDAAAAIGDTDVRISYSGSINVPAQEVEVRGKPGWNYAGASHYTEIEGPEENSIHPHLHFSETTRSRLRAQPDVSETDNDHPKARGRTGLSNASTIPLQPWMDATRYAGSTSNPPGSAQKPCLMLEPWNPNANTNGEGTPIFQGGVGGQTIYWGGCIGHTDATKGQVIYKPGTGRGFEFGCLNNATFQVDRRTLAGSPDDSNTIKFRSKWWFVLSCNDTGNQTSTYYTNLTVPVTYTAGAVGMPIDWQGNATADVVPLQSNDAAVDSQGVVDVVNESTDTADIPITAGTIPTAHSHRVRLEKGDHTYKVKTDAISIDPENLETTFDIGVDSSISIDSAVQPFIVMEYLIKI